MSRIWSWVLVLVFFSFTFFPFPVNAEKTETWWEIILRVAGISATPSSLKGPLDKPENGELWIVNAEGEDRCQIVEGSSFRSPIFRQDQNSVLALKGNEIVEIKVSCLIETPTSLFSVLGIAKLVGGVKDDSDTILILQKDSAVGLLSLETGAVDLLPYDAKSLEDRQMVNHLRECLGTMAILACMSNDRQMLPLEVSPLSGPMYYLRKANSLQGIFQAVKASIATNHLFLQMGLWWCTSRNLSPNLVGSPAQRSC